jgi:hypothetical protein
VPFLERLHEKLEAGKEPDIGMSDEEYRQRRKDYKLAKKAKLQETPEITGSANDLNLDEIYREIPDSEKLD